MGVLGAFVWGLDPWTPHARAAYPWLLPPNVLAVAIVGGAVSWKLVERPIIQLGYRLRYAHGVDRHTRGLGDISVHGPREGHSAA